MYKLHYSKDEVIVYEKQQNYGMFIIIEGGITIKQDKSE